MNRLSRTALATGVLGAGCLAYGTLLERRWYRLQRLQLPGTLRRPADTADGRLRILHVSDVHLVPGQDHRIRFLASLARLDHDLVVATGDLLGAPDTEDLAADALAPLTSGGRPGLVVLGSNDLYGPVPKTPVAYFIEPDRRRFGPRLDTDRFVDRLGAYGYRTLRGEACTIETAAGRVAVGGFDDPHLPETVIPTPEVLRPPDAGDVVASLGLVHAPYLAALDVLVDAGHEVLLAGHTHGGQVRVPGVGALIANCDLPLDQARGASRYRGRWLHVSAGLGHNRYAPVRFACRPEATLLELSP
ncbi:metallophosphoesterase [Egicoccus halophilus]|uniref:Metallophosphoesterase n=1 Tax=Egicoccus halophilus TaxID=1670830 RepID=A0A8J3A5D5_9ACTN|nr:metallophosphoesterase [Egicoccus halophilus]GGI02754.1 metallophosphoesterase [Egicoccus halophilus]